MFRLSQFSAGKVERFHINRYITVVNLFFFIINMFFIQKLVNNNLFKNIHIIILWNVLQVIGFQIPPVS